MKVYRIECSVVYAFFAYEDTNSARAQGRTGLPAVKRELLKGFRKNFVVGGEQTVLDFVEVYNFGFYRYSVRVCAAFKVGQGYSHRGAMANKIRTAVTAHTHCAESTFSRQ
jgi:hypothetical protein